LYLLPKAVINDAFVRARMDFVLVADLTDVSDICQQSIQTCAIEGQATALPLFASDPFFVVPAPTIEFAYHGQQGTMLQVQLEDGAHSGRLLRIDDEALSFWIDFVAQQWQSADPQAFATCRRFFIAGSFRNEFAFKLCKAQEDVEN